MKFRLKFIGTILFCSFQAQAKQNAFLWGAASAAFQVEGSPVASDWNEWTSLPGKLPTKQTPTPRPIFGIDMKKTLSLQKI